MTFSLAWHRSTRELRQRQQSSYHTVSDCFRGFRSTPARARGMCFFLHEPVVQLKTLEQPIPGSAAHSHDLSWTPVRSLSHQGEKPENDEGEERCRLVCLAEAIYCISFWTFPSYWQVLLGTYCRLSDQFFCLIVSILPCPVFLLSFIFRCSLFLQHAVFPQLAFLVRALNSLPNSCRRMAIRRASKRARPDLFFFENHRNTSGSLNASILSLQGWEDVAKAIQWVSGSDVFCEDTCIHWFDSFGYAAVPGDMIVAGIH